MKSEQEEQKVEAAAMADEELLGCARQKPWQQHDIGELTTAGSIWCDTGNEQRDPLVEDPGE